MTWVKLDDGFGDHPKVLELSDGAFRLHIRALCWTARQEKDGAITIAAQRALGAKAKQVAELVSARLWEQATDGHVIHDYLKYNPSRAKLETEREATRARVQRFRNTVTEAPSGVHKSAPVAPLQPPLVTVPPSRPVPARPDPGDSNESLAQRAQAILDNPHDGRYSRPSKWPEVIAASAALAPGKDLKLRDDAGKDSDLRTILDAFAAGYSVADLERAGLAARSDAWFAKLDRPGPCAFTATVLRRLLAEKPPGQVAHEASAGKLGTGGRKWTPAGQDSDGNTIIWQDENGRTTYKNPFQEAS